MILGNRGESWGGRKKRGGRATHDNTYVVVRTFANTIKTLQASCNPLISLRFLSALFSQSLNLSGSFPYRDYVGVIVGIHSWGSRRAKEEKGGGFRGFRF